VLHAASGHNLAVHELEQLPVVFDVQTLSPIGIVSRSDLVKPTLARLNEEHKRASAFGAYDLAQLKGAFRRSVAPGGEAGRSSARSVRADVLGLQL
jgi:hypothetical protein